MCDEEKAEVIITNIQRFCMNDGPGIRTTVFFKGCSVRCPWCCNPENISSEVQKFKKENNVGEYGFYISLGDLYKEIVKDRDFYDSSIDDVDGGVTFSGGECLLQIPKLGWLLKKLKNDNIHIAVETSLFSPTSYLIEAVEYVDLFFVDFKIMDVLNCKNVLNGDIAQFLINFKYLINNSNAIVVRLPIIKGYTDDVDNVELVCNTINEYYDYNSRKICGIELIKEHNLGHDKYVALKEYDNSLCIPVFGGISDERIKVLKSVVLDKTMNKIPVDVLSI